jgi:hypothetical protein
MKLKLSEWAHMRLRTAKSRKAETDAAMFNYLNKVLVLLRLKEPSGKATCTPLRESRLFWDFQIFNVADHNTRSKWVDLYYAVRRFFLYSPYGNPRQAYREVKWFIQRGRRGFSDRDVWSIDYYVNGWMPAALRRLKETKHGVPGVMFELEDCGEDGQTTDEGMARAGARWDAIMDKMIAGFEADKRAQDGIYEEELGEYPLDRPSGISAAAWAKVRHDRHEASKLLAKRDEALSIEGRELFMKYYRNLWD